MAQRFSRIALATALATAGMGIALPTPAHADPSADCLAANKVWVIVEDTDGSTTGNCATDLTNGITALKSAGFAVITDSYGMVKTIDDITADYTATKTWWGYYHRTRTATTWTPWTFSNVGAGSYKPAPGTIEGWKVTATSNTTPQNTPPWFRPNIELKGITIAGTPKVGQTLTANVASVFPTNPELTYQWRRNGVEIAGATKRTYVPTAADAGKRMSVRVLASSPDFGGALRGSSETTAVAFADTQAPSTGITIAKSAGKAVITLKSRDLPLVGGSGVKVINYRVDGVGAVITTTTNPVNITVGRGTHYITFWGVDKAGNTEAKRTIKDIRVV